MKKTIFCILLIFCFSFCILGLNSCKTGEGCPANEALKVPTDKDGNLSTKRGTSNLLPKNKRKKKKSS